MGSVIGYTLYTTISFTLTRVYNFVSGILWTIAKRRMRFSIQNIMDATFLTGYILGLIFLHYPATEYIATILLFLIHIGFVAYTYYKIGIQTVLSFIPIPALGFNGQIPVKYIFSTIGYLMLFSMGLLLFMYYGLHQKFSVKGAAINVGSKLNKETLLMIKRMIFTSTAALWTFYLAAQMHKEVFDAFMERYKISPMVGGFTLTIILALLYTIFIVYDLRLRTNTISVPE